MLPKFKVPDIDNLNLNHKLNHADHCDSPPAYKKYVLVDSFNARYAIKNEPMVYYLAEKLIES